MALAGALALQACRPAAPGAPPERLVLVVVDTLRRDFLSPYGAENPTPHVAALAERGQVFTNAVASYHQTSMSMAALFTGRTPSLEAGRSQETLPWNGSTWCGMARFLERGPLPLCLPEALPTLAERLRDAGYWTMGASSNQLLFEPSGFSRGFDDWIEVGRDGAEEIPEWNREMGWTKTRWQRVNRAAVELLNRRASDRFFLYVHYMDVHSYDVRKVTYAETVSEADAAFGALLARMDAAGLLDGAVVLLTSDHGEQLGERYPTRDGPTYSHVGNPSHEPVLRVPLIAAPPVVEDPTRFLRGEDVYDLVLEIAGVEEGRPRDLAPDELFVSEFRWRTYRKGRWKSTLERDTGRLLLFDLEEDPAEHRDVADAHPDVAAAHRVRIEQLSRALAAGAAPRARLSEPDRRRLRALGYLEDRAREE